MSTAEHNREVVAKLLEQIGVMMEDKIRTYLLRENIPAWINLNDNIYDSITHFVDEQGLKVGSDSPHAPFIEYGRKPGKAPPFDVIYEWVRAKVTSEEPQATRIAFRVQKKIAERGLEPRRFLYKAAAEFVGEHSA